MAASPEVKDNAPVEDLEEGELPSSDEEFEGNDSISCHTEHKDSVTNGSNEQETDEHSTDTANNRKRPFESPEHDKSCTSDTNSDSAKVETMYIHVVIIILACCCFFTCKLQYDI